MDEQMQTIIISKATTKLISCLIANGYTESSFPAIQMGLWIMHNSAWSALGNNNRQEAEDSHISLTDRGFYNKSEKFPQVFPE